MGDHPVVRPDGLALDVPGPHQDLLGLGQAEPGAAESLPELRHLHDARVVGDEDAPRMERLGGVLHHPPRLGQVEDDAVQVRLVDALVHVLRLDTVAAQPGKASTFVTARRAKSSRTS